MNPGWPAPRYWLLLTGALVAAPIGQGSSAAEAPQSVEQLVIQRREELRAARGAHQAALGAFNVVDRQFTQALDEVRAARRSGDNARLERAYALALDRSGPHRAQEVRLQEAAATLVRAQRAMVEILTVRMEEILRVLDAAPAPEQRARLNALFLDNQREMQGLEAEAAEGFRLTRVVMPEINFDPRDGPDELRAKAELLELRATAADSLIADTDRRIQDLNRRLRIERQGRDFLAGAERFDDTRIPVVGGRPAGDRTPASDSAVAGARPMTLEERVTALTEYRRQLETYRDEARVRARQFRIRLGGSA